MFWAYFKTKRQQILTATQNSEQTSGTQRFVKISVVCVVERLVVESQKTEILKNSAEKVILLHECI